MSLETEPDYIGLYAIWFTALKCGKGDVELRLCERIERRVRVQTVAVSPISVEGSYAPAGVFLDLVSCPVVGFNSVKHISLFPGAVSRCLRLDHIHLGREEDTPVQIDGRIKTSEGPRGGIGTYTLVVRVLDDVHRSTRDLNDAYQVDVRPIAETDAPCVVYENVFLVFGWKYDPDLPDCPYSASEELTYQPNQSKKDKPIPLCNVKEPCNIEEWIEKPEKRVRLLYERQDSPAPAPAQP